MLESTVPRKTRPTAMRPRPIHHQLRLTLLSAALLATAAGAQSDRSLADRLLACDALQNAQDRLACFNSIVDSIKVPSAGGVGAQAGSSPSIDVSPQSLPAPPAEPLPVENAEPSPEPAPDVVAEPPAASQPEPVAATPATGRRPAPSTPTPSPASGPSSVAPETPVREEPSPRPASLTGEAVIVRVWENYDGRFTVELDNGHVWRETQGTRVGIPDVGARVEITRSVFGSYRMKIDGIPQIAWIRQTD